MSFHSIRTYRQTGGVMRLAFDLQCEGLVTIRVVQVDEQQSSHAAHMSGPTPDMVGTGKLNGLAGTAPEPDDRAICGRLLVGRGTDTCDPVCSIHPGHPGSCRP